MHRKASFDASGSSLNVVVNPRRVDKLAGEDRYSEPAGSFPRVLTDNKARVASEEG